MLQDAETEFYVDLAPLASLTHLIELDVSEAYDDIFCEIDMTWYLEMECYLNLLHLSEKLFEFSHRIARNVSALTTLTRLERLLLPADEVEGLSFISNIAQFPQYSDLDFFADISAMSFEFFIPHMFHSVSLRLLWIRVPRASRTDIKAKCQHLGALNTSYLTAWEWYR